MSPDRADLFGLDRALTPAERKRLKAPQPQGHAWKPGTGPAGETCGSCQHIVRLQYGNTYHKCGLNERAWTRSVKTDIRRRDPACLKWEPARD